MSEQVTPIRRIAGTAVPVRGDDIDTDRIVPARFLKEVTFDNMGEYAFYDARRSEDGSLNDHPFNHYTGANVLVVNENFGCGSSREHAPQALMRWGIEAVVGESFAEIFADNCTSLGVPTVTLPADDVEWIQDRVEEDPDVAVEVDVEDEEVRVGDRTFKADVDPQEREMLLQGIWDTTALMRSNMDLVEEVYERLPYTSGYEE